MTAPLVFKAGPEARRKIERDGLQADSIAAMAGAAGGPKWLVLSEVDRLLAGSWLSTRKRPLPLVGSSIGSWRFAAWAQADPLAAIDRLETLYIGQSYAGKPDYATVTRTARSLVAELLGEKGTKEILTHPWARLHIVTALCRGWTGRDGLLPMTAGFGLATLLNTVNRRWLAALLERHVFADAREGALPDSAFPGFHTRLLSLGDHNLASALLASGSIPFVMEAVGVAGEQGWYRDGGMVDYHMDLPLSSDGVVLMPHFSKLIVPGWLDKFVPGRKPVNLRNTLVIHPSDPWIETLPNRKIPDRQDFTHYQGNDAGRFRDWRTVARRSAELADFLAERLEKQDIPDFLQPL